MKERILESFPWWCKDKEVRRSRQLKIRLLFCEKSFLDFHLASSFAFPLNWGAITSITEQAHRWREKNQKRFVFLEKSFFANSKYILRYNVISCHIYRTRVRSLLAPSGALIAIPTNYWSASAPTFSDLTGPQHWTFTFWATTAM